MNKTTNTYKQWIKTYHELRRHCNHEKTYPTGRFSIPDLDVTIQSDRIFIKFLTKKILMENSNDES
jgi:hypothetical protein